MRNIKLVIAYDGKNYLGWQKTPTGPSIENALQLALEQILQENVALQAASRTDAGVHARGQVVNFISANPILLSKLHTSLNSLLPDDIVVLSVQQAADAFHPTLDCTAKEYHYALCFGPIQFPQDRLYSWHYPYLLDINAMRDAAKHLVGEHDFRSFCNFKKNEVYENWMRIITEISIDEISPNHLQIKVIGNSFLYKMVRNIVGTLAQTGRGLLKPDDMPAILQGQNRVLAGVTAPAHGLCLYQVFYK